MRLLLWLVILGQVLICLVFCAYSTSGKDDEEDLSQYFYLQSQGENHHVIEQTKSSGDSKPDFLYSPSYPNGRIVTFYAHWCPHCKHFQPKYKELSNKIWEMSTKLHVLVETFAVSCVPHRKLCSENKIEGYPTILFYPPNSINGTKMKYWDMHPHEIFELMGVSAADLGDKVEDADSSSSISDNKHHDNNNLKQNPYFLSRSRHATFHDAHLSFDFAMKTAIYSSTGPLPEQPKATLKKFLGLMRKTVPVASTLQPVIHDLLHDFDTVAASSKNLNTIMANHAPPRPINKWSPASLQHGTGYTAGLWELFHVMSVGLVQWNHMAMEDDQKIIPAEMADILRDYVEHFFQCEVCRLNFLSEFDACSYDRCNRLVTSTRRGTLQQFIQYPLWLFETHNAVNARLRKERIDLNVETEDYTNEEDVLWPPINSCRRCWISRGRWDEIEVYKYLQQSYWLKDDDSEVLKMLDNNETGMMKYESSIVDTLEDVVERSYLFHTGPLCCVILSVLILWYRKRQYDKRGIHKKIEIDIP